MCHEGSQCVRKWFPGENVSKSYVHRNAEATFGISNGNGNAYDGIEIGMRRVDFFVENQIMVELKAIIELNDANLNQCRNYLEAYNKPVGVLLNFGSNSLQYKRIYNTKHPEATRC